MELASEVYELHKAKGGDYGNEERYFPFDDKSYIQMLHVKVQRLVSLAQAPDVPNFESIEDTVKDLLNYSFFYLKYLKSIPL